MNIGSLTSIHIINILKYFLLIIPLIISLRIEAQWRKNKIIVELKFWNNTSNGNPEENNRFVPAKFFFMLNMLATVIAWNIFYSFKIPIPSTTFLISFLLLSVLCGIYLLYIRMNFKYEE
ncbi:MAG: hypothetical protein WBA39_02710 [Rivularia sp. (in: cyanobacteria)]